MSYVGFKGSKVQQSSKPTWYFGFGVGVGVFVCVGVGVIVGVTVGVGVGVGDSQSHVSGVEFHTVTSPSVTNGLGSEYVKVSAHAQNVKLERGKTFKVIWALPKMERLKQSV